MYKTIVTVRAENKKNMLGRVRCYIQVTPSGVTTSRTLAPSPIHHSSFIFHHFLYKPLVLPEHAPMSPSALFAPRGCLDFTPKRVDRQTCIVTCWAKR